MSRPTTITLIAPNGAKVRTVFSKRYFVVGYWSDPIRENGAIVGRVDHATIVRRTDSSMAALAALRKHSHSVVIAVSNDGQFKNTLTLTEVEDRAYTEKTTKQFAARQGNIGLARSRFPY